MQGADREARRMKIIIMGCGRVGARLAHLLSEDGHDVTILDTDSYSFRRLPSGFKGKAIVGNGLDMDTLKKVGIEEADVFVAVTQGDNRNVMASQIAKHIFKVPKVLCRIYDPIREEMYKGLGIRTISSTKIIADLLKKMVEE